MRLKRLAFTAVFAVVWLIPEVSAYAANNGTVTAHVDVAAPCLTLTTTDVSFGTLGFSPDNAAPSQGFQPIAYTNCGGASEKIVGHGSNATGPGGTPVWSLEGNDGQICPGRGVNNYRLGVQSTLQPTLNVLLSSTDQDVETVAGGASGSVNRLYLHMPCAGSAGSGTTMNFQATFTATF